MDDPDVKEDAIAIILARSSALVESTLVSDYGLPKEEAERLARELSEWFDRLTRRPGTPTSLVALRAQLVSMTCKVGHVYWSGKLGTANPVNETLKRTLALGPEVIAFEVEKRLEAAEKPL
jgi:hypothetical protein